MTGMLVNNFTPYAYADLIVNAGETSTGLKVGAASYNNVVSVLSNYGTTISTMVSSGGQEIVYDGGVTSHTIVKNDGISSFLLF